MQKTFPLFIFIFLTFNSFTHYCFANATDPIPQPIFDTDQTIEDTIIKSSHAILGFHGMTSNDHSIITSLEISWKGELPFGIFESSDVDSFLKTIFTIMRAQIGIHPSSEPFSLDDRLTQHWPNFEMEAIHVTTLISKKAESNPVQWDVIDFVLGDVKSLSNSNVGINIMKMFNLEARWDVVGESYSGSAISAGLGVGYNTIERLFQKGVSTERESGLSPIFAKIVGTQVLSEDTKLKAIIEAYPLFGAHNGFGMNAEAELSKKLFSSLYGALKAQIFYNDFNSSTTETNSKFYSYFFSGNISWAF